MPFPRGEGTRSTRFDERYDMALAHCSTGERRALLAPRRTAHMPQCACKRSRRSILCTTVSPRAWPPRSRAQASLTVSRRRLRGRGSAAFTRVCRWGVQRHLTRGRRGVAADGPDVLPRTHVHVVRCGTPPISTTAHLHHRPSPPPTSAQANRRRSSSRCEA